MKLSSGKNLNLLNVVSVETKSAKEYPSRGDAQVTLSNGHVLSVTSEDAQTITEFFEEVEESFQRSWRSTAS